MSNLLDSLEFLGGEVVNPSGSNDSAKEQRIFKKGNYVEETIDSLAKKRYAVNTKMRNGLAIWSAFIVTAWLFVVAIVLLSFGQFGLSDTVLVTLLTTTTINVIGLVLIVIKDLFHGESESVLFKNKK